MKQNPTYEDLEIKNQELETWVNTQDRERLVAEIKRKGGVSNAEVQRRTKSGKIITTLFSAETMYLGG